MGWEVLAEELELTPQRIKQRVHLASVLQALGVVMGPSGAEWIGYCPWHNDTQPSLRVWVSRHGGHKFTCHPCGITGDIFDLLLRAGCRSFTEAKRVAIEFVGQEFISVASENTDFNALYQECREAHRPEMLENFLRHKQMTIPSGWVTETFGVVATDEAIWAPHGNGSVSGLKKRFTGTWAKGAVRGSRFDQLYAGWSLGHTTVVVCEGETDTWIVSWILRDSPVSVVGLPAGVASPSSLWYDCLVEVEQIYILLDSDEAGERCSEQWLGVFPDSRILKLPAGEDCTSTEEKFLVNMFSSQGLLTIH